MKARAIWKGVITYDKVQIPVNLYSAVVDRSIHFHLLHDQDMVRLQQRLVNAETNRTVTYDTAKKAAAASPEEWVILDEAELSKLEPPVSRDIAVMHFVETAALSHQWYDRPYLLGPDKDESDYHAFAQALKRQDHIGICRWVMRKKRYLGALYATDGHLILHTLRYFEDIMPVSKFDQPAGPKLDSKERRLAEQLTEALEGSFDPKQYQDEYQERVRNLIEAKQKGKTVEVDEYEERPQPGTLEAGLRASLQALKG